MDAGPTPRSPISAGEVAARVLRRAVRKLPLSPSTWLLSAVVAVPFVVVNGHLPQTPMAFASPSRDAADRYVQALQTGNVDTFLASLSPYARTKIGILGRFTGAPGSQAERRAAQVVLAQDHIDRYT